MVQGESGRSLETSFFVPCRIRRQVRNPVKGPDAVWPAATPGLPEEAVDRIRRVGLLSLSVKDEMLRWVHRRPRRPSRVGGRCRHKIEGG